MRLAPLITVFFLLFTVSHAEQLVIVSLSKDKKIAVYALDPDAGRLDLRATLPLAASPGCMCIDPTGSRLYVAMKGSGSIAGYRIGEGAALVPLGEVEVGADASFLSFHPSGKFLFSSYYKDGQIALHRVADDGKLSAKPVEVHKTDERAHCVVCDPLGETVFVPHTRPNKIYTFQFDAAGATLTAPDHFALQTDEGTGPRHLFFHPTNGHAYGSNEQGSSATVYHYKKAFVGLGTRQTITTLPRGGVEGKKSTSDIEVHPSGKFVYVANRGYNAIAGFAVDDEEATLTPIGHTATEAVTRSFNITSDGRHLIAAGQISGNLAVFEIDEAGGLTRKSTIAAGKGPWWVQTVER